MVRLILTVAAIAIMATASAGKIKATFRDPCNPSVEQMARNEVLACVAKEDKWRKPCLVSAEHRLTIRMRQLLDNGCISTATTIGFQSGWPDLWSFRITHVDGHVSELDFIYDTFSDEFSRTILEQSREEGR